MMAANAPLPLRHLDMDLLRALVAIADSGSFSAAGQQLGRSQSAVSLQIKRLEDLVGHVLLDRANGRVVGPTEEGRLLIDYGRRILRLNDEAYSVFAQPGLAGRLRVGVPEELMEGVFPDVIAAFARACPRVELSLRCDISVRLQAALDAGELDLAVTKRVGGATSGGTGGASGTAAGGASVRVLRREPLVWFSGEAGDAHRRRPLPLAVFHEGCVFRVAALAALAKAKIPAQAAFVGNGFTGIRHAVAAGLAVTPLPRSMACDGLVQVKSGLPRLPDCELVATFAAGEASAAARRLVALLEERLWGRTAVAA